MASEKRVKLLGFEMDRSTYVTIQATLIPCLLLLATVAFFTGRESGIWLFRNAWWLLLVLAVAEGVESALVLGTSKD